MLKAWCKGVSDIKTSLDYSNHPARSLWKFELPVWLLRMTSCWEKSSNFSKKFFNYTDFSVLMAKLFRQKYKFKLTKLLSYDHMNNPDELLNQIGLNFLSYFRNKKSNMVSRILNSEFWWIFFFLFQEIM